VDVSPSLHSFIGIQIHLAGVLIVAESLRDHGMFVFFIGINFLTAADRSIFILLCAFD